MSFYSPPKWTEPEILYHDDYLVVVNKPAGLLSVPGRGESKADCMATRVQAVFDSALVVHRLDMATSGIMLMALDKDTHRSLGKMFENREVEKTYIAVVDGLVEQAKGIIEAPMRCDWPNRPRQMIDPVQGKPAITRYLCLQHDLSTNTSLLELQPVTGRSHQLRVHLQSIGHPIVGDALYNPGDTDPGAEKRMLLHASRLTFTHPVSSKPVTVINEPDFPDKPRNK